MDTAYLIFVLIISSVALWRWWRFGQTLAWLIQKVENGIGERSANTLRIVCVVLIVPAILYFFVVTVQMAIKLSIFTDCLPGESVVTRVVSCIVGDPFRYIRR